MADMESIERRLLQIEQKLDSLMSRSAFSDDGIAKPAKSNKSRSGRVFFGLLIVVISLVWLGQNFDIQWLSRLNILPLVLIGFGIYLAFGGRDY